jgi:hypothetical protein
LSRTFRAEIVEFSIHATHLAVEKSPAISQVRIVLTKLIAVVAQGQAGLFALKLTKKLNEMPIGNRLGI